VSADPRPRRYETALAAAAYLVAMAVLSWPLPRALAGSIVDPIGPFRAWGRADLELLCWILAWTAHALGHDPRRLFDGNILHPAPNVLAGSENLLGLLPVSAPVFLVSGNAALTYNVTIAAVILAAALSMFALVRAWTGDRLAAWTAGAIFAFSPEVLFDWTRLHASAVHFFPLVLLLFWQAAASPTRRTLLLLALATALQVLAGVYVTYELGVLLAAAVPLAWWRARQHGHTIVPAFGALAVGACALAVVAPAYLTALRLGVIYQAARPDAFHGLAMSPGQLAAELARALGVLVPALAVIGLAAGGPRAHRLGMLFVAAVGFLIALGPTSYGPYTFLARVVPGFSGIRAPGRFAILCVLAASVLAGMGAATLRRAGAARVGGAAGAAAVLAVATALVLGSRPAAPIRLLARGPDAPAFAAARWLGDRADGEAVLELPAMTFAYDVPALETTTIAMMASTLYWPPLVNGYTGHPPPSAQLAMTLAQRLPDATALATLRRVTNVGWVVAHGKPAPSWPPGAGSPSLVPAGDVPDARIYRVVGGQGDLVERVRDTLATGDDGRTLLDLPRTALVGRAARGRVGGTLPERFVAGMPGKVFVDVTNRSRTPWPGLSVWPAGTVGLQSRWRAPDTRAVVIEGPWLPLGEDLAPKETLRAQAALVVPEPGRYVLEVGLVQMTADGTGHWFADQPGGRGLVARSVDAVAWGTR
jgi:hypothetical protein